HRRNHYELSKLERAKNDEHVKQMLEVLRKTDDEPSKNIYLYYALGKELEDLERWSEAFDYYKQAGDAVKTVSDHDVATDVAIMDKIIEVCTRDWLVDAPSTRGTASTPIFIVGLPRTGTTLTDRVISGHSRVESGGETQLLQMVLRHQSGVDSKVDMSPEIVEAAARAEPGSIASAYVKAMSHRLGDKPFFVEKLPENVLYLGFIARSWPDARIIHMRRHPMDACFALYKQSYFRFAYSLDDLADYYLAYDRLSRHWREMLGDRMIEVEYENLVSDPERETRRMLNSLGLRFEEACLEFDRNVAPIATASSVQVREKMHRRSVGKWRNFEGQLQPLRDRLERGGVAI
ncbi:MAG: sulfotransferase, partial [Gammaproteobacteria bacterium]|nr:sulfotransferase [Gammaproteobacteria bacterium]